MNVATGQDRTDLLCTKTLFAVIKYLLDLQHELCLFLLIFAAIRSSEDVIVEGSSCNFESIAQFVNAVWIIWAIVKRFKGGKLEEYQRIYHHSFEQDVNDVLFQANAPELTIEEIKERYFKAMKQSAVHFGQMYPNVATIAGTLRIFLKSVASEQGVGLSSTGACTGE